MLGEGGRGDYMSQQRTLEQLIWAVGRTKESYAQCTAVQLIRLGEGAGALAGWKISAWAHFQICFSGRSLLNLNSHSFCACSIVLHSGAPFPGAEKGSRSGREGGPAAAAAANCRILVLRADAVWCSGLLLKVKPIEKPTLWPENVSLWCVDYLRLIMFQ